MTSTIHETCARKLDIKMKNNNRKIALVNKCIAHHALHGLTNFKLLFLPPNNTAKTQPVGHLLKKHTTRKI